MLHLASVLLVSLVALCGITAYADTHWVNLAGSNLPPYTSFATGARSIQDAIDQTVAGDTVRIDAGIHRLDTTVFLRDSIAVIGAGRDSTVIMPREEMHVFSHWPMLLLGGGSGRAGGGLTLKSCTIRDLRTLNTNAPQHSGVVLYLKRTTTNLIVDNRFCYCNFGVDAGEINVIVADNIFDSCMYGISIYWRGPFDIHHNTINGRDLLNGVPQWCGSGIEGSELYLQGPARIHHNTIVSCRGWGIAVNGTSDSILIYNNLVVTSGYDGLTASCNCDGLVVRNNTIIRTLPDPGWWVAAFIPSGASRIVVENNVFAAAGGLVEFLYDDFYDDLGGTIRFAYNDLWGLDSGSGEIYGVKYDPRLVMDTAGNPFRDPMLTSDTTHWLQRGSPLIDAGNPLLLDADGSRSDVGWTGGPDGISYIYPEEPPKRPDTLIGQISDQIVYLAWSRNTEADLAEYRIYRDAYSGFVPHSGNLLAHVALDTSYTDHVAGISGDLFYVLTAVDTTGLEGPPSHEVARFPTGISQEEEGDTATSSDSFSLVAYPNPTNSSVIIEFVGSLATSPDILTVMSVFDILGRKLVDLFPTYQGSRRWIAVWNGMDGSGTNVTSGIYFVRVASQGQHIVRKICLLR